MVGEKRHVEVDAVAPDGRDLERDGGDYPSTKDVYGSNYCHIGAKVDNRTHTVVVTSVIDNLVKGAAGQAIQNMNLMFDIPETRGLEGTGLWP